MMSQHSSNENLNVESNPLGEGSAVLPSANIPESALQRKRAVTIQHGDTYNIMGGRIETLVGTQGLDSSSNHIWIEDTISKMIKSIWRLQLFNINTATLKEFLNPLLYEVSVLGFVEGFQEVKLTDDFNIMKQVFKLENPIPEPNLYGGGAKCILLLGNIGEGKTTFLRHYYKEVSQNSIPELENIKLVLLLDCEVLASLKEPMHLWDFILLGHVCPDIKPNEPQALVEWIIENHEKVMFIFDAVEKLNLYTSETNPCNYYNKSIPAKFISDIVSGHLFEGAKVLMAARPFGVKNIPEKCFPQRILILGGLPLPDVEYHIQNNCENTATFIRKHGALSLFGNPWLVNNSQSILRENFGVATIGSLSFSLVKQILHNKDHVQSKSFSLKNLCKLAYIGINSNKLGYLVNDITNSNLSTDDLKDFMFTVPSNSNTWERDLSRRDWSYYFINSQFQQICCAMYVCSSLKFDEFEKFVNRSDKWSATVANMVDGLVWDERIVEEMMKLFNARSIVDLKKKKLFFHVSQFKANNEAAVYFLHECNDVILKTKPTEEGIEITKGLLDYEINLPNKRLSLYSMMCIGHLLINNKDLWLIEMKNCGLTKQHLEALDTILSGSTKKISAVQELIVSNNPKVVGSYLAKIITKLSVKRLKLRDCEITAEEFQGFASELNASTKLTTIDLFKNKLTLDMMASLEKLMTCVDELYITSSADYVDGNVEKAIKDASEKYNCYIY